MPDYSSKYFTTRSLASGNTISFTVKARLTTSYATSISYSTDSGTTWNTTTINGTDKTISVSNLGNGDEVWWKGIATSWVISGSTTADYMNTSNFGATGDYEIEGNIMSLLHGDDFQDKFTLTGENNFAFLFNASTTLKNAYNLVLPATTLTDRCYRSLLQACSGLVTPMKELPAMTLTTSCYQGMFDSDSAMTSAPKLPATTLANSCYNNMFLRCRALTSSPVLPAPTLVTDCYRAMFHTCVALKHIICLATSGLGSSTCGGWTTSVPTGSSGLFEYASGASWSRGTDGVPTGWNMVVYVPPFLVDVETISTPASGSAYTVNLTSSNPWTASTNDSWITVSPSTGTGDTALTITISENKLLGRNGTVVLTDSDNNSITISVYQTKASLSLKSCSVARSGRIVNRMYREGQLILLNVAHKPHIDPSSDELEFTREASSTTITVDSNLTWTASTSASWITITTGASALNVSVSENTTGDEREGSITITGGNILGTVTTSITVSQLYVTKYSKQYLTVRSREDNNTITFFVASSATQGKTIQYSTDGGSNWTSFTMGSSNQTKTISLNSGETVMFKGDCDRMGTENTTNKYSRIYGSKTIDVEGNIMSLLYGDDFIGKTSFKSTAHTYTFMKFFEESKIVNAGNLVLPATTLNVNCYRTMMWKNGSMVTAPELLADTLVELCYYHIFEACSSLASIKCLATSGVDSNNSTAAWVNGVNASGTFYKKTGATWPTGANGIPSGWTVEEVDY